MARHHRHRAGAVDHARAGNNKIPSSVATSPLRLMVLRPGTTHASLYVTAIAAHDLSDGRRVVSFVEIARATGLGVDDIARAGGATGVVPVRWLAEGHRVAGWNTAVLAAVVIGAAPPHPVLTALRRALWRLLNGFPTVRVP